MLISELQLVAIQDRSDGGSNQGSVTEGREKCLDSRYTTI